MGIKSRTSVEHKIFILLILLLSIPNPGLIIDFEFRFIIFDSTLVCENTKTKYIFNNIRS
jgi:hypothetical protein